MGIYSNYVFPLLLEWALGTEELGEQRRVALATATGETLEIGFGTGLNLAYYPKTVTRLTMIDSEKMLQKRVEKRISMAPVPVVQLQFDATGRLPFDDQTFETVVTTMTLCSISDTAPALAQIRRVLKPNGKFIFFEHGRSDNPDLARQQDRLNPIQRMIAGGCNLNRRIDLMIEGAGFEMTALDRFQMPKTPRILAEMYRGAATPTVPRGEP